MPVQLADHHAIRALTARYNRAADDGDLDTYADCFTPDGVFDVAGVVRLQGHDQLKTMIGALAFPTRHATMDATTEIDGDRATQISSFVLFGRRPEENDMRVLTTAINHDELTRTPAGWRFTQRRVTPDNDLGRMLAEFHPPLLELFAALG